MDTTVTGSLPKTAPDDAEAGWALVLCWSADEPHRVGEVLQLPKTAPLLVGRGEARADDPHTRAQLLRQRPGISLKQPPLTSKRLSRQQLRIEPLRGQIRVDVLGRCPTFVNGARVAKRAQLSEGDTLLLEEALLFVCVRRARELPPLRDHDDPRFPFGAVDDFGIVGESPSAWQLRDRAAFVAPAPGHVLLTGDSGVGKELVAQALHRQSPRAEGRLVARNAATLPEGIIDAELFGHAANYPNPGTPERRGIIGEADGGTLFLDEIGELPQALQAHLLRVLDGKGEYQRLGETATRRSDFRLIAATNRPESELKPDLLARFKLRMHVDDLASRREDVPLLLQHLARSAAAADQRVRERFFTSEHARFDATLVSALVRHEYTLNVRELDNLLWTAITESTGDRIELTDGVAARLNHKATHVDPASLTRGDIEAALTAADHNRERATHILGLKNRDVLYRLIKKHGIEV